MRPLLLMLAAAMLCPAQTVRPNTTARIEGRVLTLDGKPAARVSVYLIGGVRADPPPMYEETTSPDGRFVADGLPPGSYQITASGRGYVAPPTPDYFPPQISVKAGETRGGVTLRVMPKVVLSGVVSDADGLPAEGVRVELLHYKYSWGAMRLTVAASDDTDAAGRFYLPNIPKGQHYLRAYRKQTSPAYQNVVRLSAKDKDWPTFYPNSLKVEDATRINVASAPIVNLQLKMLRGTTHSVRGAFDGSSPFRVIAVPKGTVLTERTFLPAALNDDGNLIYDGRVGFAGHFEVPLLPPGDYAIIGLYGVLEGEVRKTARVEVAVRDTDVDDINLTPAVWKLTGRILPGADPSHGPSQSAKYLRLTPADERAMFYSEPQVNADGTFTANLPTGEYLVNPAFGLRALNHSIRLGDRDITNQRLNLRADASLEIQLSLKKDATLALRLSPDLIPASSPGEVAHYRTYQVSVWPAVADRGTAQGSVITFGMTAMAGIIAPIGFPPGEYYYAVFEDALPPDLLDIPDFLRRFNALAERITLKEGERLETYPKLIPHLEIAKALKEFP